MAVKPRKAKNEKKPISKELIDYFETGEENFEIWGLSKKKFEAALEYYETELLPLWIIEKPCTRPWCWWAYIAPKEPVPGWDKHFNTAQRKRLGGVGDPNFEHLNYGPNFSYGIPTGWVTEFDTQYYNGKARDVHGKIIPTNYKAGNFKGVAIDPDDPPIYESEAAYLERLGLLTPTEKRYLEKHPGLLESERIEIES